MRSPVHQVRKGQQWSVELSIEPHTEVMESHLRCHARLKPTEVVGPFAVEAERMPELLIDCLHDLAYPRQPASERLGPGRSAIALRRADNLGAIGPPPGCLVGLPLEAFVNDVRPRGWSAHTREARVGTAAESKERFCQGLIFGTCRPKAEAGDRPDGVDRQQQMEPGALDDSYAPIFSCRYRGNT